MLPLRGRIASLLLALEIPHSTSRHLVGPHVFCFVGLVQCDSDLPFRLLTLSTRVSLSWKLRPADAVKEVDMTATR
jgi:hypothetical protein